MVSLNDYITFLSTSMNIFGYFRKIFGYGSQFSFSPGNIRNSGFSLWILRGFNSKGANPGKCREKGRGKSFRKRGKLGERIGMGELRA